LKNQQRFATESTGLDSLEISSFTSKDIIVLIKFKTFKLQGDGEKKQARDP
jgi:hypothetical protein